ncbi:MAG: type II toxin-antitoxin system HicA family toxin [Planctomycetota bacterium]|nr:type II toxin-antitoxin system HicA family toxin [Planctomycetota bacterium]
MPTKLPAVNGRQVIAALRKHGFSVDRIKGSHHVLMKPGHRRVIVPVHSGKDVKPGTLRNIIKSAGLTEAEFVDAL